MEELSKENHTNTTNELLQKIINKKKEHAAKIIKGQHSVNKCEEHMHNRNKRSCEYSLSFIPGKKINVNFTNEKISESILK